VQFLISSVLDAILENLNFDKMISTTVGDDDDNDHEVPLVDWTDSSLIFVVTGILVFVDLFEMTK